MQWVTVRLSVWKETGKKKNSVQDIWQASPQARQLVCGRTVVPSNTQFTRCATMAVSYSSLFSSMLPPLSVSLPLMHATQWKAHCAGFAGGHIMTVILSCMDAIYRAVARNFSKGAEWVGPPFFCLWVRWYMCNIHIQNVNIWGGGGVSEQPPNHPPGIWHMHSVLWEESLKRSHYIRFCTTGIIITLNCICNNVHQLQIEHDAARSSYACFKHCFKMYVVVQQKNQWLLKNRASAESVSHCTKWASTSIPTHSKCSRLSWVQQEDRFVLKRTASVSHHSEQEHKWHTCTDTENKMHMKQQRAVPCDPLGCYPQLANTQLIMYIFCPTTMTLWGQMKTLK